MTVQCRKLRGPAWQAVPDLVAEVGAGLGIPQSTVDALRTHLRNCPAGFVTVRPTPATHEITVEWVQVGRRWTWASAEIWASDEPSPPNLPPYNIYQVLRRIHRARERMLEDALRRLAARRLGCHVEWAVPIGRSIRCMLSDGTVALINRDGVFELEPVSLESPVVSLVTRLLWNAFGQETAEALLQGRLPDFVRLRLLEQKI